MIKAGVHYGHLKCNSHPKMKSFILKTHNNIQIFNLEKSKFFLQKALIALKKIKDNRGNILFVGTKRAACHLVENIANNCKQFYINYRWLGGLLTNWKTINKSLKKFNLLEQQYKYDKFIKLPKKESIYLKKELIKFKINFTGIKKMDKIPDALFIIDALYDKYAIKEANILGIPVFSIVDSNINPIGIDYIIPGNDDSISSIKYILNNIEKIIF